MEIFLSWSGERSRRVAEAFRTWLPQVIQALKPWMSPEIDKGARWSEAISERLERVRVGILCLTSDNLMEPWLLFEAGAISKIKDSRVCTFLLDVKPGNVKPPLGQFQHTALAKDDVHKLVNALNADLPKAGGTSLEKPVLDATFDKFWPDFEAHLRNIAAERPEKEPGQRNDSEKLDELLDIVRSLQRREIERQLEGGPSSPRWWTPEQVSSLTTNNILAEILRRDFLAQDLGTGLLGRSKPEGIINAARKRQDEKDKDGGSEEK